MWLNALTAKRTVQGKYRNTHILTQRPGRNYLHEPEAPYTIPNVGPLIASSPPPPSLKPLSHLLLAPQSPHWRKRRINKERGVLAWLCYWVTRRTELQGVWWRQRMKNFVYLIWNMKKVWYFPKRMEIVYSLNEAMRAKFYKICMKTNCNFSLPCDTN